MTCPMPSHTTAVDYRRGCRCEPARRAYWSQVKKRHLSPHRRLEATGTRRRLQALKALGWSTTALAAEVGVGTAAVADCVYGYRDAVSARFAGLVYAAYDRLWDTPGGCVLAADAAARNGWAPPLFWLDDEIDNPAVTPDYQPYKPMRGDELAAEAIRLSQRGLSAVEVAERLGVSDRTVVRARSRVAA